MASGLEQFVNNVCALSAQGNYRGLSEMIAVSSEVLIKNSQHLDNVLETMNIAQHSLGYMAVLHAKLVTSSSQTTSSEAQLNQVKDFITNCIGEQIRFSPESFASLCHLVTEKYIAEKQFMKGIPVILKAIQKVQLHSNQLTSIHADLCQLCLLARCFKPVIPILEADITSINNEGNQFDTRYFLLYYYYGGMIYVAMKNYDRALYFFEVAVTTPARTLSHIMLEAYKKYVLVSLILHGKYVCTPKYTSQIISRFIKPLSVGYQELPAAYLTNNPAEVRKVIRKYQELFQDEQNYGLVKQVLQSLFKKNIQRLTKTFLTLSLSDVANKIQLPGPADAEKYILNMIEDGEIYATINQKDGMVIFRDAPEKYDTPETLSDLEKRMSESAALAKKVQEMEIEIIKDPLFIKKSFCILDQEASGSQPTASYVV